VIDASASEPGEREAAVERVLGEIGAGERPRILVLNKIDRLPDTRVEALRRERGGSVLVSARTGEGMEGLLEAMTARLELETRRVRLRFTSDDRVAISAVYASGRVLEHEEEEGEVTLQAELPERLLARYRENLR
jgi:GTP-binding protein HflX